MKNKTLVFLLLFCGYPFIGKSQNAIFPKGIEHVIIIGLDGTSSDGIRMANMPYTQKLIQTGAVKRNVRTVMPSSSSPNWASMFMGAGTEAHGIIDNDWGRADYTLPPIVSMEDGLFPTIFGWLRKNNPAAEIGVVYQWSGFGRLFEKSAVNYDKNMPNEKATTNTFCNYIENKKPTLGFMHIDHIDDIGHEFGHATPNYYDALHSIDSLIGQVQKSIQKAGIQETTLLIITADHGGVGYGHGGATVEEAEITMILNGNSIKKGYSIQQQVYTYDLAATIAFALKIIPPYVWTGRPIKSAFKGFKEPDNLYLGKTMIPYPRIEPWKNLYADAGGLFIGKQPKVQIKTMAESAKTYYTLDGTLPTLKSKLYQNEFTLNESTVVNSFSIDDKGNTSLPSTAYFRIVPQNYRPGVQVKYYDGNKQGWNQLPYFNLLKSLENWDNYEFEIDRNKVNSFLNNGNSTFALQLESNIKIDSTGDYTFYIRSDDGSKLFIDNKEVVNNNGDHGVIEKNGTITLTKGIHLIRVDYYNGSGGFWLNVLYKGPGIVKQIIGADKLLAP